MKNKKIEEIIRETDWRGLNETFMAYEVASEIKQIIIDCIRKEWKRAGRNEAPYLPTLEDKILKL